jgi:hypothetical protein
VLPEDQGPLAREVAVPTADLWRRLHANQAAAGSENEGEGGPEGGEGEQQGEAVARLRSVVRGCSMPLPWKCAMDREVQALGRRVGASMRAARAETWRRQRQARVDQLDDVRELLLVQKDKFERQLDGASARRDDLLDARSSGTFAGFAALALDEDEDGDGGAENGKAGKAKEVATAPPLPLPPPPPPANEAQTKAQAAALALEVAQCRAMVSELEARLDTVDDLYGLLLDEEEDQEDEDEDEDDKDDREVAESAEAGAAGNESGPGKEEDETAAQAATEDGDRSSRRSMEPTSAAAAATASAAGASGTGSGLPSLPLPGADRIRRALRPATGAARQGAGPEAGTPAAVALQAAAAAEAAAEAEAAALRAAAEAAVRQRQAARAAAAQAEAAGARVSGALAQSAPRLRLDLVDAICAMALGRLPKRPRVAADAHLGHLAWLHADLRQHWALEFGALAHDTRNWELAVPVAPPRLLGAEER